jgi:hypothetical protein
MKKKRKFIISLLYTVQKDVAVEAESLEEAKENAIKKAGGDIKEEPGVLQAVCRNLIVRDNETGKTFYRERKSA